MLSGLILAGIISANFSMYVVTKADSKKVDNIALKSLKSNLLVDIIVTTVSWIILLLTPYALWVWIIFDPLVGILIGVWMAILGTLYLRPVLKYIDGEKVE